MSEFKHEPGPIHCKGAAFDDFRLTDHLPPQAAPAVIERDRLHMAARPGFNRKLLPLRIEPETYEQAVAFCDWVANEFELDGVLILNRPDFADVSAHVWHVLGAHDFKPLRSAQHVYRTEIWKLTSAGAADRLAGRWTSLRDEAAEAGYSALWFLYNDEKAEVSLVTIAERPAPHAAPTPDFLALRTLESARSQEAGWEREGWARKTFDRTHWVYTIWFPNTGRPDSEPAIWPNSPPLPAPGSVAARSAA
jgi:hypothetical protein